MSVLQDETATTTVVHSATKRSLLTLSHAMERAFDAGQGDQSQALVLGLFQRRAYFEVERARYADLARRGATVVVGFVGDTSGMPAGVHAVGFDLDDPLANEWTLVVLDGSLGSALVATDDDAVVADCGSLEASRRFSARWTFHRAAAAAEAERLRSVLGTRLSADVDRAIASATSSSLQTGSTDAELRLAAATESLVGAFQRLHHATMDLGRRLEHSRNEAEHDQLTGLRNRHFLDRFLTGSEQSSPLTLSALLVDLDDLKAINDGLGHAAGDAALVAVADALRSTLRPSDVVIRWGGDEFLVLLPGAEDTAALSIADRLVSAVRERRLPAPWTSHRLSVSIGVSQARPTEIPLVALDIALHQAKATGKDAAVLLPH